MIKSAYSYTLLVAGALRFVLICFSWAVVSTVLLPFLPAHAGRRVGRAGAMGCFRIFLATLEIAGAWRLDLRELDRLKDAGPLIIAPNHPGLLDAVLVVSRLPNAVCVMKASLLRNFLLGPASRLARYVGASTGEPHLVYAVHDDDRARLEEKLRRMLIGKKPRLVLQLGGGQRGAWRDWPVERYVQLIRLCMMELSTDIFILGGEDQEERLKELDRHFANDGGKPYHNLVNKLTLAESAALLTSAGALVSTDTGIMHLGFAVGTRVVALIHCNNPVNRVGPYCYGNRHRVVQLARPANYQTPADASMGDIPAQTVLLRLKEIGIQ